MKRILGVFSMLFLVTISFASAAGAAATSAAAKSSITDQFTGMEFVFVKGGCFQMGDGFGDGGSDEQPVHEVCVDDFYLGKYEVTLGEWEKVMHKNPSSRKECGPDCPAESISWYSIQEFIGRLKSAGGQQYRLPTEAEWEYAARSGGKKEKWAGTSEEKLLVDFALFNKDGGASKPEKKGLKKPNGLGLFDMTGNVAEWCQDFYGEAYYAASPKDNPTGPVAGERRVLRGGGHVDPAKNSRTTTRLNDEPHMTDFSYGFRLLRPAK